MKRNVKRFLSLALIACLVLALFTGVAGAAGSVSQNVKNRLYTEVREKGYSRNYIDQYHFVDAGQEGDAVTVKLPHDLSVSGRSVVVAVLAVDANGNALPNHEVHYILGTYGSGAVTVTYQESDCRYFAMVPIQSVIEQGTIHNLETTGRNNNNGTYDIFVRADLMMSDDLATYVVMNLEDDKLKDMRFTCELENDVLTSEHQADFDANFVFTDEYGVYVQLENSVTDNGLMIRYKLKESTLEGWRRDYRAGSKSLNEIKAELQNNVYMTCSAVVDEDDLWDVANDDNEIWTHGHLDLTYEPNGRVTEIPAVRLDMIRIPGKMDYIKLTKTGGSDDVHHDDRDEDEKELAPIPSALNGVDHVAYIIGYEGDVVRPNANITRAEVATIFFRLLKDSVREANMTQENDFSDVTEGQWFNCAISTMASMEVLNGYPDGTFRPNAPITRAEFAAIAARFDGREADDLADFSDIKGHWGAEEISRAYENGWVDGYPNGTFCPDQDITRAEAMTLVNRVLHRNPETKADLLPGMAVWNDNLNENAWYYLAVQEATNSHEYNRKPNTHENWTELEAIPDWSLLEK